MRRQILLAVTVRFLIYFTYWLVLAHLPVLLKGAGMDDAANGLMIGILSLASMLLMVPMGVFADFFSPKRTMLAGSVLLTGYVCLLPLAIGSRWLALLMVMGGLGAAALIVVSEALYLKLFGQQRRGLRVALYQMSTYLGFGLGPLAGGFLLDWTSNALFAVATATSLLILLLGGRLQDFEGKFFSFRRYGRDLFQFRPLLLLSCVFVLGTHFGVEQSTISLLMTRKLGFAPREVGLLFAGLGLWMALTVPVIGYCHDRGRAVFVFLLAGMGISGLFQILTAWAWNFQSLMVIRLLHTLGDAIALLELTVLTAMVFPASRLGGNSGLLYAVRAMATFAAALASGILSQHFGYGGPFLVNGLLVVTFVAGAFLLVVSRPENRRAVGWAGPEE